jgi:hypothetical protein
MAAKRHHHKMMAYSKEDHSAMRYERKPMHKAEYSHGLSRYDGAESMRHMDRGMIHADWSQPALVPQGTMNKDWPRVDYGIQDAPPMLFSGVNRQMSNESSTARRERSRRKF